MIISNKLKLLKAFINCLIAVIVISIVYTSFFGFDLSDEGFNLISSSPDQPLGWALNYYSRFFGFLGQFFSIGPVELRLLRLVHHVFASFLFAKSIIHLLNSVQVTVHSPVFSLVFLVGFSTYWVFPNSLTYNALTFNLVQISIAILIRLVIVRTFSAGMILKGYLSLSLIICALIYIKITSAILLFIFISVVLLLNSVWRKDKGIRYTGLVIFVISTFSLLFSAHLSEFITSPFDIIRKASLVSSLETSHEPLRLAVAGVRMFVYMVFSFGSGALLSYTFSSQKWRLLPFSLAGFALLLWVAKGEIVPHTMAMYFLVYLLAWLGFSFQIAFIKITTHRKIPT